MRARLPAGGAPELHERRLGEHGIVEGAQLLADALVRGDALGLLGTRSEPGIDLGAPGCAKPAVGIPLQVGLGNRQTVAHFLLHQLELRRGRLPEHQQASFSRARDSRDMTVPIGIPSVRATSS